MICCFIQNWIATFDKGTFKVRSLKIPEFWPPPPLFVALSPQRYVGLGQNSLFPPQFLYLWNLEKRS